MTTNNQAIAVSGIHHITAVSASAADNFEFYTGVLGLQLVKKTVNFDDPTTYHLYYGDQAGQPGTIMTFFPWEQLSRGKPGAGMVSAIAFAVSRPSMGYWRQRLADNRVAVDETVRFDEPVLRFNDPHGLPLELVGTQPSTGGDGTDIAIRGFHSATLLLNHLPATRTIIGDCLGMRFEGNQGRRYRFSMPDRQSPGHLLDVVEDASAPQGRPGSGTVHHIAFRTQDARHQQIWQARLRDHGLGVTDVRDRKYFQSIYFNEPGGILFEIATDPPGFAVDEDPHQLGASLKLPTQFESMRAQIQAQLPPLESPGFKYVYAPGESTTATDVTFVALHGTGGNEHDLLPLVRQISPESAVISPRGKVLENGMPRFFERMAQGVFDADEVKRRAHELAEFLEKTALRYQRPGNGLVALGYSNGANIAAAIILLRPGFFSRAVLLRPMLPLLPVDMPDLSSLSVLITRGRFDQVIPANGTDQLIRVLEQAGAGVDVVEVDAGHEITSTDIETIQQWITNTDTDDFLGEMTADHMSG